MEEIDIENLMKRAHDNVEAAVRELTVYHNDMDTLDERLWRQLEERDGKLIEKEDYITALGERDEMKMKTICYKYFDEHRALRHQWRKEQIENRGGHKEERDQHAKGKKTRRRRATTRREAKTRTRSTRSSEYGESKTYDSTYVNSITDIITGSYVRTAKTNETSAYTTRTTTRSRRLSTVDYSRRRRRIHQPVLSPRLRLDSHNFHVKLN
eukprot:6462909-Amphidinium_carterae.1